MLEKTVKYYDSNGGVGHQCLELIHNYLKEYMKEFNITDLKWELKNVQVLKLLVNRLPVFYLFIKSIALHRLSQLKGQHNQVDASKIFDESG